MKRMTKVYSTLGLIAAVSLIAGVIVFLSSFPFGNAKAETILNPKYFQTVDISREVDAEGVNSLDFSLAAANVKVVCGDSPTFRVTMKGAFFGTGTADAVVEKRGGTLYVENSLTDTGFDWGWSFGALFDPMEVSITVPKTSFESLKLKAAAANVNLDEKLNFKTADILASASNLTGAINAERLDFVMNAGAADVKVSTGEIDAVWSATGIKADFSAACAGKITLNASDAKLVFPQDCDMKIKATLSASSLKDMLFSGGSYVADSVLGSGSKLLNLTVSAANVLLTAA